MLITTKNGDCGISEYFGKKADKGGELLEAVGTLDELQAVLGLVKLEKLQNDIYEIMGKKFKAERIKELEKEIEKLEKKIKIDKKFVIFKNEKAIKLNWVRTIVRRAERRATAFKDKNVLIYLNRLSDFIYLLALKEE
jgi:cob(I)alamin adenosyltransferase